MVEEIFLVGIDSEWFETYFKTKISKSKIFSRVNFFSWDSVVFGQNSQNNEKITISKNGKNSQSMTKSKFLIKLAPKAKPSSGLRDWPTKRDAFHSFNLKMTL